MPADPPPSKPPASLPSTPLRSTAPDVALGPTFAAMGFAPGRFATAIQRALQGTHALQRVVEDSTAVFVLELRDGGTAQACRGWRYNFTNSGPQVRSEEWFREQLGYRGRYTVTGGIAEVELAADEAVCPTIRESSLQLRRATDLRLRCVLAVPRDHAMLSAPVLLCQWLGATTGEPAAHLVEGLAPADWFVLGTGNGLRVKVTGSPAGAHTGRPPSVTAAPADAPLGHDAWERSF